MLSVSGARGIVGATMTPAVAADFAAAWGTIVRERAARAGGGGTAGASGPPLVVLGRDSRPSGAMLAEAARAGLELGVNAYSGTVGDSGEGRWTIDEAVANAVPVPVISAALFARFASRQDDSPAMRAVAALRNQFGGHAVEPPADG